MVLVAPQRRALGTPDLSRTGLSLRHGGVTRTFSRASDYFWRKHPLINRAVSLIWGQHYVSPFRLFGELAKRSLRTATNTIPPTVSLMDRRVDKRIRAIARVEFGQRRLSRKLGRVFLRFALPYWSYLSKALLLFQFPTRVDPKKAAPKPVFYLDDLPG